MSNAHQLICLLAYICLVATRYWEQTIHCYQVLVPDTRYWEQLDALNGIIESGYCFSLLYQMPFEISRTPENGALYFFSVGRWCSYAVQPLMRFGMVYISNLSDFFFFSYWRMLVLFWVDADARSSHEAHIKFFSEGSAVSDINTILAQSKGYYCREKLIRNKLVRYLEQPSLWLNGQHGCMNHGLFIITRVTKIGLKYGKQKR